MKTYTPTDNMHNYPKETGHNNNESAKKRRECFMMQFIYLAYSLYHTNNRKLVQCQCGNKNIHINMQKMALR